jgi:hypothetical protein
MIPSCLPTCTRERGHARGCPVKAAEDAGVMFDAPVVAQGVSQLAAALQPDPSRIVEYRGPVPPQVVHEPTPAEVWQHALNEVATAKAALVMLQQKVVDAQARVERAILGERDAWQSMSEMHDKLVKRMKE